MFPLASKFLSLSTVLPPEPYELVRPARRVAARSSPNVLADLHRMQSVAQVGHLLRSSGALVRQHQDLASRDYV